MANESPRWTLISVLFSSLPLSASLAATLHEAAVDLYRRDVAMGPVAGDLMNGRVVNLGYGVSDSIEDSFSLVKSAAISGVGALVT